MEEARVVRFAESANKGRGDRKKFLGKRRGTRKGKRMSGPAISTTTAAGIYEALKSVDRRNEVAGYCDQDEVLKFAVELVLKEFLQDFAGFEKGQTARGLQRFQELPPPSFVNLGESVTAKLLAIHRNFPTLATQQGSSTVSSNGTMVSVDLDFDETDELAAFRVVIAAAFEASKMRRTNKEEFVEEAGKIFNTKKPEYKRAVEYVVPADYEPGEPTGAGDDGKGTVDSLYDAMSSAAGSAFTTWGKVQSGGRFNHLYVYVFKQQGF